MNEIQQPKNNKSTDSTWTATNKKFSFCSMLTMKTSTKMYLSLVLSTACIMFYQYQLSKASLISSIQNTNGLINNNGIENDVVRGKKINDLYFFLLSAFYPNNG